MYTNIILNVYFKLKNILSSFCIIISINSYILNSFREDVHLQIRKYVLQDTECNESI